MAKSSSIPLTLSVLIAFVAAVALGSLLMFQGMKYAWKTIVPPPQSATASPYVPDTCNKKWTPSMTKLRVGDVACNARFVRISSHRYVSPRYYLELRRDQDKKIQASIYFGELEAYRCVPKNEQDITFVFDERDKLSFKFNKDEKGSYSCGIVNDRAFIDRLLKAKTVRLGDGYDSRLFEVDGLNLSLIP